MKKADNRLFHTGLYVESLRQMRMMGLVYLLLSLIFAILPPLLGGFSSFYPVQAGEHAMVLYVFDFAAPLTLCYAAFGYLTRRNASDFYHSLPVSREAAYFSRTAAVATYLLITIVLTVPASFLAMTFTGSIVNWLQVLPLISYHFVASLLVMSCTLVGLAAAGTYFSSFVVAGLALFLPQLLMYTLNLTIDAVAYTVYPETLSFLLDIPLNIPAGLIAYVLSGGFNLVNDATAYIFYAPAHLYTLALAVLTLLIGCVIHNRRRSETARSAAPNRFLQHLYRSLIAMPLFLIIGTMIASNESWGTDYESYVILMVVGLLVYFLYELITTRKWRNLIGAAKVLPIVLVIALVLPWLGFGIGHAADDNIPTREKIESVTLDVRSRHATSPNYEQLALSRYEYTDDNMIDILHEALSMTVDYHDRNGTYIGAVAVTVPIEELYEKDVYSQTGYRTLDVQFNLKGGKEMVRQIRLTPEQYNKVYALRSEDEGFRSIIADLPEIDNIRGMRLAGSIVYDEPTEYSAITKQEIWDTFCEEFAALSLKDQLALSGFNQNVDYVYDAPVAVENPSLHLAESELGYDYYDSGNTLQIVGFEGMRAFGNNYKITSLTPKTMVLMMQYVNDMAAELNGIYPLSDTISGIEALEEEDSVNFYMNLRVYDPQQRHTGHIDLSRTVLSAEQMADPEMAEEIARDLAYSAYPNYVTHDYLDAMVEALNILSRGTTEITDLDSPIVLMDNVSWDSYKTYMGYSSPSTFFKLSEADFLELMELLTPYITAE